MLMPDQLPSADFMAKGAASLVPITNSRCDMAAASAASGVCARHGAANSVNAPINAAIIADTCIVDCIVARSGTAVTRENSIAIRGLGIVLPAPLLWKGPRGDSARRITVQIAVQIAGAPPQMARA